MSHDEEAIRRFYQQHGLDVIINDMLQGLCETKPENLWQGLRDGIETARLKRNKVGSKAAAAGGDCDIGLIGMAVMGQNLILNMADNGFKVCAHNRSKEKVDKFIKEGAAKGHKNVVGAESNEDFCSRLSKPRKVMLMVQAGKPVDDFIEALLPYLEKGDIVIDGGNSHFPDTCRRVEFCAARGLLFVGAGVSGGEEGARNGPSIMPGGAKEAWPYVSKIFQSICAKSSGEPCCDWVGDGSSGHYVKMVHNGIEYGDMQIICEGYQMMRDALGMSPDEMSEVFAEYNKGDLDSYLIEITTNILKFKDEKGEPLVEKIRDTAGQKGTGKWTGIESLQHGVPVTLIGESVYARCLSALKDQRVAASKQIKPVATSPFSGDKAAFTKKIGQALLASKLVSYAQGFMLLRAAAKEFGWTLNYQGIALMWRGGCIIRSAFLGKIRDAFAKNPTLECLLLDDWFKTKISECEAGWREVVAECVKCGIPCPTLSTALAFWDGYRTERLPANLLQAQRDYFGAHTYEFVSAPGEFHHTNWTGTGGDVASTTYNK
eukprot:TRINITY_DN2387_c1_g1_i1.p2 TRINITY_DN2387_c1_g1~~TRINITY_DN2387_c1_g1_i1.p2  ORF type:complete len:546 (+),score=212.62 TRINITY_DN2387_c1_g1_i1:64-1701(+)